MEENKVTIPVHSPGINEKVFFLIAGMGMSIPLTLYVNQIADGFLTGLSANATVLISAILFAPFIEEFSKIYPLFYRHGETQRSIIKLALLVGLGFGLVEMLTYVFLLGVPIFARIPVLFFHPASTSISAYGVATNRTVPFYLAAVGLHLSYNFVAITNAFPVLTASFIMGLTVFLSIRFYNRAKERIILPTG